MWHGITTYKIYNIYPMFTTSCHYTDTFETHVYNMLCLKCVSNTLAHSHPAFQIVTKACPILILTVVG